MSITLVHESALSLSLTCVGVFSWAFTLDSSLCGSFFGPYASKLASLMMVLPLDQNSHLKAMHTQQEDRAV